MNKCKICGKELGQTYIEDVTQCCMDCLRLFTELDDDDMTRDDFEVMDNSDEEYLTEHWLFKNKDR